MSRSSWVRRRQRRESIRLFVVLVILCLLASLAAFGMKSLWTSVGSAKPVRYEPVDVPPQAVSPRHQKEREEYERRERVLTEKNR